MSKKNKTPEMTPPVDEASAVAVKQPKKKKKKGSGLMGRIIRRFFLLLFTVIVLVVVALCMVLNLIFNGPSPAARDVLTMSLLEPSGTKWMPGLFMSDELVEEIRSKQGAELSSDVSDGSSVIIKKNNTVSGGNDEFADYPDGIYIERISGKTYTAHVMIIEDPTRVYMATSTEKYSTSIPGTRITDEIETEGAIAAINAGAFYDDGTANAIVGSVPAGLVIVDGEVKSNAYHGLVPEEGFAGFNSEGKLIVAKSMTPEQAKEYDIQYGCEFGPVLIMDGQINQEAYNTNSGWNPRTAIGQRSDGTVIFLCVDGRQAGSVGGTYADVIDIMIEYGAVNACNMDGGSSSVMLYRDTYGLYGEAGLVQMINNYSLLQSQPRKMPNFWMVRPASEE
ncbi:MAG: phosphodiester glycosidase family protein [Oscillospiraceae bacterium]|nr:phosphodiester glycosidase family protein [Oscillospiraceae bacterium]